VLDRLVHGQSSESELRWNEDAFWGFWGKRLAANEGFRTSQDRKDRTSVLACDRLGKWLPQNRSSQTAAISFPHNLLHSQVTREYHHCRWVLFLSQIFEVGGCSWLVWIFPNGARACKAEHTSVFLALHESVNARAEFSVLDPIGAEHTLCPRFRRRRARLRPLHREGV
jgi:hypothetical protein